MPEKDGSHVLGVVPRADEEPADNPRSEGKVGDSNHRRSGHGHVIV